MSAPVQDGNPLRNFENVYYGASVPFANVSLEEGKSNDLPVHLQDV